MYQVVHDLTNVYILGVIQETWWQQERGLFAYDVEVIEEVWTQHEHNQLADALIEDGFDLNSLIWPLLSDDALSSQDLKDMEMAPGLEDNGSSKSVMAIISSTQSTRVEEERGDEPEVAALNATTIPSSHTIKREEGNVLVDTKNALLAEEDKLVSTKSASDSKTPSDAIEDHPLV